MKFIIDTHDLEVSSGMLEMILENELAFPIHVSEYNDNSEDNNNVK